MFKNITRMDLVVIGLLSCFVIGIGMAIIYREPWWLIMTALSFIVIYAG
jgi:uncharacterized membrane protein YccC